VGDRDDKPGWIERQKRSFSELDRLRRERRDRRDEAPRGEKARARSAEATHRYLRQIDGLFGKTPRGAETERLALAMREAHGTPGLAGACRAYRDALGVPDDPRDLALFLDARDEEIVVAALEALRRHLGSGPVEIGPGMRSQIRLLAEDPSDRIAEAAEDALAALDAASG